MVILVNKGTYEIIEKRPVILRVESLGAGIAVGFINKELKLIGLLSYLFPYREQDLEVDGAYLYSGESLFSMVERELEKRRVNLETTRWFLAGASRFLSDDSPLDLAERNLKVAEFWFKKNNLLEKVIKKVGLSLPFSFEVNGKEGVFEIKIKNRVERYE